MPTCLVSKLAEFSAMRSILRNLKKIKEELNHIRVSQQLIQPLSQSTAEPLN